MHWPTVLLLALTVVGCSGTPVTTPPSPAPAPSEPAYATINYLGDAEPRHELDLFVPKGAKDPPMLLFIHGGAWLNGDKNDFHKFGVVWEEQGYAVALVDYRLSSSGNVKHPMHIQDVVAAYKWLVANAGKYGYRADRIFIVGHSAGAHIAASLATGDYIKDVKPSPIAFVGLEGIYDIPNLNAKWPRYRSWFLTKAFGDAKNWPAASPTRLKPVIASPWLVIHSNQDELVDVDQSKDFAAHLKAANVPVDLQIGKFFHHEEVAESLIDPESDVYGLVSSFLKAHRS